MNLLRALFRAIWGAIVYVALGAYSIKFWLLMLTLPYIGFSIILWMFLRALSDDDWDPVWVPLVFLTGKVLLTGLLQIPLIWCGFIHRNQLKRGVTFAGLILVRLAACILMGAVSGLLYLFYVQFYLAAGF